MPAKSPGLRFEAEISLEADIRSLLIEIAEVDYGTDV